MYNYTKYKRSGKAAKSCCFKIQKGEIMSFQEAVTSVFNNYANFNGRARRSEYWYFVLFTMCVNVILSVIGRFFAGSDAMTMVITAITGIFSLAIIVTQIAVAVRRLHDIGKSGWLYLLILIPLVGQILLIVWFCTDSQPGDNQYGPNPKENYYNNSVY